MSDALPAHRANGSGAISLTKREMHIVSLLATGASTSSVAQDLYISPHTVAAHLGNILRRVGAANRTELVARLYATGILLQGAWPPTAIRARGPAHVTPAEHGSEVPVAMTFDALKALREAGHPVDHLPVEQQAVLAALDEAEVRVLNSIKDRLEAVAGEVEGQDLKLL